MIFWCLRFYLFETVSILTGWNKSLDKEKSMFISFKAHKHSETYNVDLEKILKQKN